eukprot:COSAG01_NODE_1043_length_11954_cov_9.077014_2_plen_393_part_00
MSHSATATPSTPPSSEEPPLEPQPEPADPSLGDGTGQTTEEGVPPESRAEIVTAVLASMWTTDPPESDPGPPPADGVLKCAPLRRLGVDGYEEAQTASLTVTALALDGEDGAALALPLAEIFASRAAKDEVEAPGCVSLDRAFTLTMVDGTKHVLEAASVEERREWLALLFEAPARQAELFKRNSVGISLLHLIQLARGTQLRDAKKLFEGLRPQDIELLNGPFQNGVTLEAAARLVQEKLGLGALGELETIQKAREIVEGLAEHKATTEMSLRSEVKEDMALICEHLGLETNWVEKDKKVGDVGWEKKSELGDGSWAVRPHSASVSTRVMSVLVRPHCFGVFAFCIIIIIIIIIIFIFPSSCVSCSSSSSSSSAPFPPSSLTSTFCCCCFC